MKHITWVAMLMACSIAAPAKDKKDKPTIQIQVVGTDAWERDVAVYHPGTNGTANTNCNTNGTATTNGDNTYGNATTNCTTTSTPGNPAYVSHRNVQQESVHAIFPDGQHVTLWCQAGFRKCANLQPGTYQAEADGDKAVRIYTYSLVTHKLMGKMKYRLIGSW